MSRCCDDVPALLQPPQKSPPVEWCAGNFTYRFKDGKVTPIPRTPTIQDGTYTNATIRTVNGCIVEIASGPNTVYSACDPCADPVPPPPPTPIDIDGNACNLSSVSSDGLLTQLITGVSSCFMFTGCGTAASPLMGVPTISTDVGNALECRPSGLFVANPSATSGVNFIGCGIEIQNGLVVALPLPFQPVLDVTSVDGSVIITRPSQCVIDLQSVPVPTPPNLTNATQGMIVVANTGNLPNPPIINNWMAAVGAANPRDVYVFVPGTLLWAQLLGVTVNT